MCCVHKLLGGCGRKQKFTAINCLLFSNHNSALYIHRKLYAFIHSCIHGIVCICLEIYIMLTHTRIVRNRDKHLTFAFAARLFLSFFCCGPFFVLKRKHNATYLQPSQHAQHCPCVERQEEREEEREGIHFISSHLISRTLNNNNE